ncbi:MAG: RNA polymerase sigma factor [Chloroflexota bacterium]
MSSLAEIYTQYAPDVYRFSLGLCGDPHLAEDLTSETFVRAIVASAPIRTKTVKAYLFTIARHLFLQSWRKEKRFFQLDEEVQLQLQVEEPGPEKIAQSREALNNLLEALQELPEIDRTALLMRAYEGLGYQDIAAALNISLSAAKVKVYRARIKLAAILNEDNYENHP